MIYIMLTAMRLLVIQHDPVSPPGPISERCADHGYDVVPHLVVDAQNFHSPNIFPDFPDFSVTECNSRFRCPAAAAYRRCASSDPA